MSNTVEPVDASKRTWLIASGCAGVAGGVAAAVPLVRYFQPSEAAKAAGAAVQADVSALKPGEMMTVEWRGKPIWILRRTQEMLESLKNHEGQLADPASDRNNIPTPDYAKNQWRSTNPEFFVAIGICTHLGCSPSSKFTPGAQPSLPNDWPGGFFCPCHGSTFDLAGRVFANKPAPDNLEIPPYTFLSETQLLIGETQQA